MKSLTWFALAGALACACGTSQATVLDFEDVAPVGSGININPGFTYSEDGFTLTPVNSDSAVLDSGFVFTMPGNTTDSFAFSYFNIITLTGPAPFALTSVVIGRYSNATSAPSLTIAATLFGGGSINATFQNLTTATLATLNWVNLLNVQFRSTDDVAIDNIVLNETDVPEPASLALFGLGLAGVAYSRRQKRS